MRLLDLMEDDQPPLDQLYAKNMHGLISPEGLAYLFKGWSNPYNGFETPYEAYEEVDAYLDSVLQIYLHGGKLYRLVFLSSIGELNTTNLGHHWVMHPSQIAYFIEGGDFRLNADHRDHHEYLITATVRKGGVSIPSGIEGYWEEQEVYLKDMSAVVDYTIRPY